MHAYEYDTSNLAYRKIYIVPVVPEVCERVILFI